ncbi:hypothetical protein E2C01_073536 [Portunus trituberculatus]|uniref:Uncharacterized protein n=1 Tax=Portunus trituberculatus TaxID=210409 RepID=A0A5B7IA01_PORTR|nr:hypothetical protein [Portunus trituberculatus]
MLRIKILVRNGITNYERCQDHHLDKLEHSLKLLKQFDVKDTSITSYKAVIVDSTPPTTPTMIASTRNTFSQSGMLLREGTKWWSDLHMYTAGNGTGAPIMLGQKG